MVDIAIAWSKEFASFFLFVCFKVCTYVFSVASELPSVVMATVRETLRKQLSVSPVSFLEEGLYDQGKHD